MPPSKRNKISDSNAARNAPQLSGVSKQWSPDQRIRTTSRPNAGAPTSLTNLAQLSGMTAVPISSTTQGPRNNVPTIPQKINIRPAQPQLIRQSALNNNIVVTNISNGIHQLAPASIASILPSIQLISPRDLSAEKSMRRGDNHISHSDSTRNKRTAVVGHADNNPLQFTSALGRFVNEPLDHHDDISPAYTIDYLNKLVQRSAATSPSSEDQSDDMSLIRLMEIFNNPALTITPVEATKVQGDSDLPLWDQSSIPSSSQSFGDMLETRGMSQLSLMPSQPSNKSKVRIPKSAANLQLLSSRSQLEHQNHQIERAHQDFEQPTIEVQEANSSLEDSQAALDWLSSLAVSRIENDSNSVTLSWVPSKAGLGEVTNNQQQQEEGIPGDTKTQTMSVQFLHQLASQAEASNNAFNTHRPNVDGLPAFEPECLITIPRVDVRHFCKEAVGQEIIYTVHGSLNNFQKRERSPLPTSKRRLWKPRAKEFNDQYDGLAAIEIKAIEDKEILISERHLVLERMLDIANSLGQRKHAPIEPDDIFVNRSKRIMSWIDTTLERKKRRRFESICDQSTSRAVSERARSYDSGDSDDSDESELSFIDESTNLFEKTVVPIQLPLDEGITDQKREHLSSVGLISREDKNKLSIQRCEDRLRKVSALAIEEMSEIVPDATYRFIDMISQTGGTDIQLRTETDIKRNELPFIEGLNRNTSRIKMGYMSALGLDKRSKRTTLYRVTKTKDLNQVQAPKQLQQQKQQQPQQQEDQQQQPRHSQYLQQPNDLISQPKQLTHPAKSQRRVVAMKARNSEPTIQNSNCQVSLEAADMITKAVRLAQASCRGAMQAPNKDDYMKSLGLTAS